MSLENITFKREIFIPRTRQAYEIKSYVYFDFEGKERSLLIRKVENWCLPTLIGFDFGKLSYSETYLMAWNILKDRGFPLVPDVWKMGEDKVATTNLIENGGSVYDRKIDAVIERDTLSMDEEFTKVSIDAVQKEAGKLLSIANKGNVELMTDDPFHIMVRPDGSWYVLALDIGKVRIYATKKDFVKAGIQNNRYYVNRSIRDFFRIQQNIKTLRDARGL